MGNELTRDEAFQVQSLLRSLRKAIEKIQGDLELSDAEKLNAKVSLQTAIAKLENPKRNRADLPTTENMFLGNLLPEDREKVHTMLKTNGLDSLALFGARTPERVKAYFASVEVTCPPALLYFNEAYQHDRRLIASVPKRNSAGTESN